MLGTQTRGSSIVVADESTELWRHPNKSLFTFDYVEIELGY